VVAVVMRGLSGWGSPPDTSYVVHMCGASQTGGSENRHLAATMLVNALVRCVLRGRVLLPSTVSVRSRTVTLLHELLLPKLRLDGTPTPRSWVARMTKRRAPTLPGKSASPCGGWVFTDLRGGVPRNSNRRA
jgi:hypothetical protein